MRVFKMAIFIAAVIAIQSLTYAASEPSSLYAGTAKVNITPDYPVISTGESFRLPDNIKAGQKNPPSNVHDSLCARVVVLKNDDVSLAIISVDLILFSSKRVVDEAKKQWGIDYVFESCAHNHSGVVPRGMCPTKGGWGWTYAMEDPGVSVDWPGLSEDPWYNEVEEKIIAAIGAASKNLFPARIAGTRAPYDSVYLGTNRRVVGANGRASMMWDNPRRIPTEPRDPQIGVIRVEDEAGKTRALMVHYSCHPVTMMGAPVITADFPGAMADYVEEELGPDCTALFLQGAQGDIDPYEYNLRGNYGHNFVRQAGIALGKAALRVSETLPSPQKSEASIDIKQSMVKIPFRRGDNSTDVCIMSAVINRDLALVNIPGEPFIQHQLNLASKSPVPNTMMLGVAYCGKGSPYVLYIPTVKSISEGGYGVSQCSFVSGDAGDRMVNAAVADIKKILKK